MRGAGFEATTLNVDGQEHIPHVTYLYGGIATFEAWLYGVHTSW